MYHQLHLAPASFAQKRNLVQLIASGAISLGGCRKTKLYGTLNCRSGKRMQAKNRVFFADEQEAINAGYRPCATCTPQQYREWKATQTNQ